MTIHFPGGSVLAKEYTLTERFYVGPTGAGGDAKTSQMSGHVLFGLGTSALTNSSTARILGSKHQSLEYVSDAGTPDYSLNILAGAYRGSGGTYLHSALNCPGAKLSVMRGTAGALTGLALALGSSGSVAHAADAAASIGTAQNIMTVTHAGDFWAKGRITNDDTTDATNTTNGSLQTDGGLSVALSAYIGASLTAVTSMTSPTLYLPVTSDTVGSSGLVSFQKKKTTGDDVAATHVLGKVSFNGWYNTAYRESAAFDSTVTAVASSYVRSTVSLVQMTGDAAYATNWSCTYDGVHTVGNTSGSTSYHKTYGSVVLNSKRNAADTHGSLSAQTTLQIGANVYHANNHGNIQATENIKGYTVAAFQRVELATSEAFYLNTNYTDTQTPDADIVTTNTRSIASWLAGGSCRFGHSTPDAVAVTHVFYLSASGANVDVNAQTAGSILMTNNDGSGIAPVIMSKSSTNNVPGLRLIAVTPDTQSAADMIFNTRFDNSTAAGAAHGTTTYKAFAWIEYTTELGSCTRGGAWTLGTGVSSTQFTVGSGLDAILYNSSNTAGYSPNVVMSRSRDTVAVPADVSTSDFLGQVIFKGYRNGGYKDGAWIYSDVESLGVSTVNATLKFATGTGLIASATYAGAWTLGFATGTTRHVLNGHLNLNPNTYETAIPTVGTPVNGDKLYWYSSTTVAEFRCWAGNGSGGGGAFNFGYGGSGTSNVDVLSIYTGVGVTAYAKKFSIKADGLTSINVTNEAASNGPGKLLIRTIDVQAADVGASIGMGGTTTDAGTVPYSFAVIAGRKENSTTANYAGYMQFCVTNAIGTIYEAGRVYGSGTPCGWAIGNNGNGYHPIALYPGNSSLSTISFTRGSYNVLICANATAGSEDIGYCNTSNTPFGGHSWWQSTGDAVQLKLGGVSGAGAWTLGVTSAIAAYTALTTVCSNSATGGNGVDWILKNSSTADGTSAFIRCQAGNSACGVVLRATYDTTATDSYSALQWIHGAGGTFRFISDNLGGVVGTVDGAGLWTLGAAGDTNIHVVNGRQLQILCTDSGAGRHAQMHIYNSGAANSAGIRFQNSVQDFVLGIDHDVSAYGFHLYNNTDAKYEMQIDTNGAWIIGRDNTNQVHYLRGDLKLVNSSETANTTKTVHIAGDNNGTNRAATTPGAELILQNTDGTANTYSSIAALDAGGDYTSRIAFVYEDNANNVGSMEFFTRPSGGALTLVGTAASTGVWTLGPASSTAQNLVVNGTVKILQGNTDSTIIELRGTSATSGCRILGGGAAGDTGYILVEMWGAATDAARKFQVQDINSTLAQFYGDGTIFFGGTYDDDVASKSPRAAYIGNDGQLGYSTSSIRYKKDLEVAPLFDLDTVKARLYRRKEQRSNEKEIGLIAEEVREICPYLVYHDKEGNVQGIHYEKLSVVLLQHVQEQKNRIEELEREMRELKKAS